MEKKVNYHKILSDALCMKWDTKYFDVHHINHNRDDNKLNNLVLIPKKLHKRYHLLVRLASSYCDDILKKDVSHITASHINTLSMLIECKNDMAIIYQEQMNAINNINRLGYSEEILDMYFANIREILIKFK